MKTFYQLLVNTLVANVTNNFLWFALVFWAYLETRSVLVTSIIGGSYMLLSAFIGLIFGPYVDHHKKKSVMFYSSLFTLVAFVIALFIYAIIPKEQLLSLTSPYFWLLVSIILAGAVAGNIRMIALSTSVTMLVPEKIHDKANGLVGTANGISFTITSVFSGLAVGQLGMGWVLGISVALTLAILAHLATVSVKEKLIKHEDDVSKKPDIKGTLKTINLVPGLLGLIFFTTFNNFLGGVFMSLMDPYGLNLMSVEAWGIMWGFVSIGFIAGGLVIAKKGLGKSPLRTLFLANIFMWIICIIFPLRSSVLLLGVGMFAYMCIIPVVEASEQTIIQKVVPFRRQGRVFGFAQSIESAASPITAYLTGPIAQLWVIPYMTDGRGAETIGKWFGSGPDRGMALIFVSAGIIGLIVTLVAMRSKSYKVLSRNYANGKLVPESAA